MEFKEGDFVKLKDPYPWTNYRRIFVVVSIVIGDITRERFLKCCNIFENHETKYSLTDSDIIHATPEEIAKAMALRISDGI